MPTKIADEYAAINARMAEIQAEKQQRSDGGTPKKLIFDRGQRVGVFMRELFDAGLATYGLSKDIDEPVMAEHIHHEPDLNVGYCLDWVNHAQQGILDRHADKALLFKQTDNNNFNLAIIFVRMRLKGMT